MKACVMSLSETAVKSKNRVEIPHFSPETLKALYKAAKNGDSLDLQGVSFGSVQHLYDCLAQYDKMVSIKKAFKKKEQGREILARLVRTHCHGKKFTTRKVVV